MIAETLSHIVRDERGVVWVDDTNVKVVELALDHLAYGWSAEAIHEQFPHLTMAQNPRGARLLLRPSGRVLRSAQSVSRHLRR